MINLSLKIWHFVYKYNFKRKQAGKFKAFSSFRVFVQIFRSIPEFRWNNYNKIKQIFLPLPFSPHRKVSKILERNDSGRNLAILVYCHDGRLSRVL